MGGDGCTIKILSEERIEIEDRVVCEEDGIDVAGMEATKRTWTRFAAQCKEDHGMVASERSDLCLEFVGVMLCETEKAEQVCRFSHAAIVQYYFEQVIRFLESRPQTQKLDEKVLHEDANGLPCQTFRLLVLQRR